MGTDQTALPRITALVTSTLAVVQLARLLLGDHDSYIDVLLMALVATLALASAQMHRDNRMEARLAAAILALLSGGGVALAATVGLPGQTDRVFGVLGALTLVLSVAILALLAIGRAHRPGGLWNRPPYAS